MMRHLVLVLLVCAGLGPLRVAGADPVALEFLFSTSESARGQRLRDPAALAVDASRGELYVADRGNGQVVVYSQTGVPVDRLSHQVQDHAGQLVRGEPCGVLPGERGTLLVSDLMSDQVDVLDLRGTVVRSINVTAALPQSGRDTHASPAKMAYDGEGNLYLVERATGRIIVFGPKGNLVRTFGRRGKGEGRLEMIADVAVGADGTVYVLDSIGTPVVDVFDKTGKWRSGFGRHSDKPEDFHHPVGLTVDPDGRLWIADAFSHEVKAYTSSGEFLQAFGGIGSGPGQFYFPSDVAVSPDGVLYVLEKAGRRLQAFRIVGASAPGRR